MAKTDPPSFGETRLDVSMKELRDFAEERLAFHHRDMEKTGDMDSYLYYEGQRDAFVELLEFITFPKPRSD